MTERSFEAGYRDGWASVAGDAPLPDNPTQPPPDELGRKTIFQLGFEYGRADALERFKPGAWRWLCANQLRATAQRGCWAW